MKLLREVERVTASESLSGTIPIEWVVVVLVPCPTSELYPEVRVEVARGLLSDASVKLYRVVECDSAAVDSLVAGTLAGAGSDCFGRSPPYLVSVLLGGVSCRE